MKKFLVRIDRQKFYKNPRAGQTKTEVIGAWNCVVIVTGSVWVPENLEDGYMLIKLSLKGEEKHGYKVVCRDSLKKLLLALSNSGVEETDIKVLEDQKVIIREHDPLPEWMFNYVPTDVECSCCNAVFHHTHLLSESNFDGLYYTESDEICPKCGYVDCCEVEYEQPQDVADELFIV